MAKKKESANVTVGKAGVKNAVAEMRRTFKGNAGSKQMKSYRLTSAKIKRARRILGTETDTGTIETALDMVVFGKELADSLLAMAGVEILAPEAADVATTVEA